MKDNTVYLSIVAKGNDDATKAVVSALASTASVMLKNFPDANVTFALNRKMGVYND